MNKIKQLFANKWIRWSVIGALVIFAAWYFMATSKRNKARQSWISWMTSQPDTSTWKKQIIDKATAAGITVEQQIRQEAFYLHPANIFQPAR